MRCPICTSRTLELWETSGRMGEEVSWWTGEYVCAQCGTLKASGTASNGTKKTVSWNPSCPSHGTQAVYQTDLSGKEWCCGLCGRRLEIAGGTLSVLWTPDSEQIARERSLDYSARLFVEQRMMGGLPHD